MLLGRVCVHSPFTSDRRCRFRRNIFRDGEPSRRVEDRRRTCDDVRVPLSEEEQRILRQIEQQLEQDPTFSQRGYRVSRRRSLLLTLGLVLGLVITIGGLAVNFVVAFVGFVIVLVMAIMLESELRLLGRERLGQLPISAWLSGRRPDVDDDATR